MACHAWNRGAQAAILTVTVEFTLLFCGPYSPNHSSVPNAMTDRYCRILLVPVIPNTDFSTGTKPDMQSHNHMYR